MPLAPVWGRAVPASLHVERGQGAWLHTTDGRRLLDFTSGIGVTNTGHAHPRVVAAVQEQAARLLHGQANIVVHQPMLRLAEALRGVLPEKLDTYFFSNSGAEIIEAAVKLAKQATRRPNIIVFSGSFHGRTHLTMAMTTSKTAYRAGHQPLVPGIFVAPFPYAYHFGWDEDAATDFCLKELKLLLKSQTAPEETAAVFIEPVLGEGGYVPAPARFLREVRDLCDHYGMLLAADEVQTGFGRTGRWFGFEHYGIVPDMVCMAKGLASGLPLSGLAASAELMARWPPGSHGGTYGGNAVACAAAVATIQVMHDERLPDRAARLGQVLLAGLRRLQEDHAEIGDVRGLGLMAATEFSRPQPGPRPEPWTERAAQAQRAALEQDLMLLSCGSYDNTLRWIPPLVASEAEIVEGLRRFEAALKANG
jgi:4-aminobutyrate aminotransferase